MSWDEAVSDAFADETISWQVVTCPHCGESWHRHSPLLHSGETAICLFDDECGKEFTVTQKNCRAINRYGCGIPST